MKQNLLIKTGAAIAVASVLGACSSDVEKGYNANFTGDQPVSFDSEQAINATLSENTGEQSVDLLQGATIGDSSAGDYEGNLAIRQIEITANKNFNTPQTESNSLSNLTISPFRISDDGRSLIVQTDKFAENLRYCDDTNIRGGGTDDDGNPIPDEYPDFPSSVTYTISYEVNNGYAYPAGAEIPRRTLELTLNAKPDPVESVAIAPVSVAVGGSEQASAATSPSYACNSNITYSIADETIATVDETTGVVTGVSEGTTTITATSVDGGFTATESVEVTAGFTIAITNGEKDELGAYTGKKSVPTCSKSAVVVEPNLAIDGKDLTGDYTFDFESSNTTDFTFESTQNYGFGLTAIYTPGSAGTSTTVTAAYSTGETHGVPASAIGDQVIELTAVDNIACQTANSDGVVYDFSYGFEHDTMINSGKDVKVSEANNSTRWVAIGNASSVSIGDGFGSTKALKVTALDVDAAFNDSIGKNGIGTLLQRWNSGAAHWTSSQFGQITSIGKTFKFSVWVKLNTLVDEGEERTITNFLFPWKTADDTSYHDVAEYNGFARRHAPFNMELTQPLANTTDWQQVEFGSYTIPAEWTGLPQPIMMGYELKGDIANGDEILLEDIAVVEVQ